MKSRFVEEAPLTMKLPSTIKLLSTWGMGLALLTTSSALSAFEYGHSLYSDPVQVGSYIHDPRPLVIAGVKRYGWAIDEDAPGILKVRYEHLSTMIEAEIHYNKQAVRIETQGPLLKADCVDDCVIHKRAENWLSNIRRAIALEFHAYAIADAGGKVEGRYQEVSLEQFKSELLSDDPAQIKRAATHIAKGYVFELNYLDLAAQRLWDLHSTSDRQLGAAAASLAKALAQNGGARYEAVLRSVAERATDLGLQRHALASLDKIIPARGELQSFAPD